MYINAIHKFHCDHHCIIAVKEGELYEGYK